MRLADALALRREMDRRNNPRFAYKVMRTARRSPYVSPFYVARDHRREALMAPEAE